MTFEEFSRLKRSLKNSEGISYLEFVRTLKPDYLKVWRDISFGYLACILSLILSAYALKSGWPIGIVIFIGAFFVGYWFHYVMLFLHAAAHGELHPSKKWNTKLANIFISSWIGMDVKKYKVIHFKHHTHLGTPLDSETSYFNSLTLKFLFQVFFGIFPLKKFFLYKKYGKTIKKEETKKNYIDLNLLSGVFLHLSIIAICWAIGGVPLTLIWLIGVGGFGLSLGVIRQLLEHRSESALESTDYIKVSHGEETRMFGEGPISSTLGGAGFNRHLLHHWDPQISYTNLKELEDFLCQTSLRETIDSKRGSYFTTFCKLFR